MIIAIIIVIICFLLPIVPFLVLHIPHIIYYGIRDLKTFIQYKKYNEFRDFGYIYSLCGYFGRGKTLSAVKIIVEDIYKKYNAKMVWDNELLEFVPQAIHIVSNVPLLGIPYVPFTSEQQLITFKDNHTTSMDITIFLLDEVGSVWNSRNFKNNISHELLTQILQCRKDKMAIYTTTQRFNFMDALIRQITYKSIECNKLWRIQKMSYYDAYELENCNNPLLIQPTKVRYWWVYDRNYEYYDTRGLVEALIKKNNEGYFVSNEEILTGQGTLQQDAAIVSKPRRKFRKRLIKK